MTRAPAAVTRLLVVLAGAAMLLFLAWPILGGASAPANAQAPAAPADAPASADPATEPAAPEAALEVGVTDPGDLLTVADEELLASEPAIMGLPPQVSHVEFVVFETGEDNLNDTMLEFAQGMRGDLVSGDSWAPGRLIVAVSMDPRRNGIYCGDDVCVAMDLFEGAHLDGSLEAMKDPLRRGNTTAGLLAGVSAAADPSVALESPGTPSWVGWAFGGAAVAAVGGIGMWIRSLRKTQASTARERYDQISREYGRVAGELDGIDVRANSLSSPLADDELRSQWEDVKQRFLELDTVMGRIGHLRPDSTDSEFRKASGDIGTAHLTVEQMDLAEKNIDEMFRMEQGDATVRRRQLGELRKDMVSAGLGTSDARLGHQSQLLQQRVDELASNTAAPDFMDRYARLVVDYRLVVDAIRQREMSDVKAAKNAGDRHAPRIYDTDWRVGHGYGGFVPYYMVSTWHTQDVQAAESASSTNTSYSSSSFSGGGGSSSW